MSIWLIGAGPMAQDYANVLDSIREPFVVIGRSESSALVFEEKTGHSVTRGGLDCALQHSKAPQMAIVAVGVEQLAKATEALIKAGTKRILLEKPGAMNLAEIESLGQCADEHAAQVLIAYNRRFYSSVELARQYIDEDAGIVSAQFEFTEWSHMIATLQKASGVKERWILANSSHVIDLAFHLIGMPSDWHCWCAGSLDWHPTSARFVGAGVTEKGVMFSYLSDWQAPGRWGLEIMTKKRRLILRPMEQLQVMQLGSLALESVEAMNILDKDFKPGLFQQTKAFLADDSTLFCTLPEQARNIQCYSKMAGYA